MDDAVAADRGGSGDVERVDAVAHRDPNPQIGCLQCRIRETVALGPEDDRAVVCTLAACRAREERAQDWYRNVAPKQRDGTIRICKQSGYAIADVCSDARGCRK